MSIKRISLLVAGMMLVAGLVGVAIPARVQAMTAQSMVSRALAGRNPLGDVIVLRGLVLATANVTNQGPAQVRAQVQSGKSIDAIAQAAGKRADDVLVSFDQGVDQLMARAVANGRLPQKAADSRAAWYKQSARLQIDQPGLTPPFPGLHEVHVLMISAAVEVTGIPRAEIRTQLTTCATLETIVASKGKTGADVATQAMQQIDARLQQAVDAGKLTPAQRDEWRAALQTTTTNMTKTPGLHVAGKECAK